MLIMVVLAARLPWLESTAGQDRLVRWHRKVAPWAIGLIIAHVTLITVGYAQAANSGILAEIRVLITSYPYILAAVAGFGLLLLAGVTSYRYVRRRMRYETWWVVHLYVYLGLALAFALQIATGIPFIGHPLVRALWIIVWAATAGMVIVFRVLQPIWRSLRHQLTVVEVRPEAPGWSRSSAGDATWTSSPCPAASSSSGASLPGTCGGRRTPTRCPRCPSRRTCG